MSISQELASYFSCPPDDTSLSDISMDRLPSHVSIIMDGNGRWAQARGLDRALGHKAGVSSLKEIVTASVRLGIKVLSVYAFSTENWKRPQHEVTLLMHLFATTLVKELPLFAQENVRLRFFGNIDALPATTRKVFKQGLQQTQHNTGMVFALAVNYGGRYDLVQAAQSIAIQVQDGKLKPSDIDEEVLSSYLYTSGLPDPDLVIRTSGEMRLSNYLLYQIAYSELYITKTLWPDFTKWDFLRAIKSYQERTRRFGGVRS